MEVDNRIYTEAQLLAAVEAERWCDSDGESCCSDDDTDFEPTVDASHPDKALHETVCTVQ